jgi:hypothetical protein
MSLEQPSVAQLSQIIAKVTAPAVLLCTVASLMTNRRDSAAETSRCAVEQPNHFFWTFAAITASVLVGRGICECILNVAQEYGVAVLFVLARAFFAASLVNLARETYSQHDIDHYR